MAPPAKEEELRETYYIHCRNKGYSIDEAAELSLAYIRRTLNAEKSLATTTYLEEAFRHSLWQPQYSSTPSSYDDNLLRHIESLVDSKATSRHGVFDGFPNMRDSLPSFFVNMRNQHENDASALGPPAPEYIFSSYDYRNNVPEPQGGSYRQSTYNPRTHSFSASYYTTEERQPASAYESCASDSTSSSKRPLPDDSKPYVTSDSHTTGSSYSFSPSARPSNSCNRPPSPRHAFYSTFDTYTNSSRDRVPPSYSHATPSSPRQPVPPRPEGIELTTNIYTVLGVTRNATVAEIRKAHRGLSLRWHPDRCTGQDEKEATEKMAEINQANDVLCDEVKRRFYDRWRVLPTET